MITAIIGANYGDEGKGLATNYFTREGKNLVVRHNGGAQSGHTVEIEDKRFVFHELSSGSFNDADTFWDSTYHPDLYTLDKECEGFKAISGKLPCIYASRDTAVTIIDDVILNQFLESNYKKGSCGMGIWECVCRNNQGYPLTLSMVDRLSVPELIAYLKRIRIHYVFPQYQAYRLRFVVDFSIGKQYEAMLYDDNILANYAAAIKENMSKYVQLVDHLENIIDDYDNVVFETGQGLCLDGEYDVLHGTPSRTGLFNITNRLNSIGKHLDEAVYVTRTYMTRHGRGSFIGDLTPSYEDKTNVYNEWQEGMQYGRFDRIEDLQRRVYADCSSVTTDIVPHLFVTHANMSDGCMFTRKGMVDISKLNFEKIYVSDNPQTVSDILDKKITLPVTYGTKKTAGRQQGVLAWK